MRSRLTCTLKTCLHSRHLSGFIRGSWFPGGTRVNNYQLDCCQEHVVMQHCGVQGRLRCVCVPTHLFDMIMPVWSSSECAPRALEHVVTAVKHRVLLNPLLQSITGVLVNLSANYKVATWIKRCCYSPLFFSVGANKSRMGEHWHFVEQPLVLSEGVLYVSHLVFISVKSLFDCWVCVRTCDDKKLDLQSAFSAAFSVQCSACSVSSQSAFSVWSDSLCFIWIIEMCC